MNCSPVWMRKGATDSRHWKCTASYSWRGRRVGRIVIAAWLTGATPWAVLPATAGHQGHEHAPSNAVHDTTGSAYPVPGAPFQVVLSKKESSGSGGMWDQALADASVQTVVETFTFMLEHRMDYPRFDESLKKNLLEQVVIEPAVFNEEGKEFPFLVTRTKVPGRVKLLISGSSLKSKGYLHHPDRLAPVLAREFQWVISKADTAPKPKTFLAERALTQAPIRSDQEILAMSGDERVRLLQQLFETYLKTVDEQKSLEGQPFYEVGATTLAQPAQPDSTIKLYDIRIREALQKIVREPYFAERTPQAVRSLLNGKIWNVAFAKIDQRDWATRTRVVPEDKAVLVGAAERRIQPATVLVNLHRSAQPDDPFYGETKGLPMGALSPDQLARVIALEIQQNVVEKSMTGHVAQDALTAPK